MKNLLAKKGKQVTSSPLLRTLIRNYEASSNEFKATRYWEDTQRQLNKIAGTISPRELRSGKHDLLRKFGFGDLVYSRPPPEATRWTKIRHSILQKLSKYFRNFPGNLPYGMNVTRARHLAYRHCDLFGQLMEAKSISEVGVSRYGSPEDMFWVGGNSYSMQFLTMYLRYAFSEAALDFKGDEILVELGQGNGMQIELLKKLYPDLTILCFDLPVQTYFSEIYLKNALGSDLIVSSGKTRHWKRLSPLQPGKVHFFGNWQFPILESAKSVDVFWNAASFGEMEPSVVENYLSYVRKVCKKIYLCNAKEGKETAAKGNSRIGGSVVDEAIGFRKYEEMLQGYRLLAKGEVWTPLAPMFQSGGYFQAIWAKDGSS